MKVSIIVPVYNMGAYAAKLVDSLIESQAFLDEIVFVDDGSTDDSLIRMKDLKRNHLLSKKITVLDLEKNLGRFEAIRRGVLLARSRHVLISNIRTEYSRSSLQAASQFLQSHQALMPHVHIDAASSIYSLYWLRTHEWLFQRNFLEARSGFRITKENFENYVKGTGGFICDKEAYLEACEKIPLTDPSSDDIFIMKYFAGKTGIWVHEDYFITWEPRQTLKEFLLRMWERGPGFVEYNFVHNKGIYWKFFLSVLCFLMMAGTLSLIYPVLWLAVPVILLFALAYQARRFSQSSSEFFKLYPLHVLVAGFFAAGVAYGLGFALGIVKKPTPIGAEKLETQDDVRTQGGSQ